MFVFSDSTKNFLLLKCKIITSLLVAACVDQFSFFHFSILQPNFSFLTLFIWIFFFGHQLSFTLVFLFGIFVDLIGGSLLGENTLIFIILYGSISFYKEHFSNDSDLEWPMLWISITLMTIFQIILISAIHCQLVFSLNHILSNGITVLFYPSIKFVIQWLIKERKSA